MRRKLILVGGLPGSGKTYIGTKLAKSTDISSYIDKDTLSCLFTEKILVLSGSCSDDRESSCYLNNARDLEYKAMIDMAFENLKLGKSVICSAPFIKEFSDKDWLKNLAIKADDLNVDVEKIWVVTSHDKMKDRIILRGESRDNWKISNWDEYLKSLPSEIPDVDDIFIYLN